MLCVSSLPLSVSSLGQFDPNDPFAYAGDSDGEDGPSMYGTVRATPADKQGTVRGAPSDASAAKKGLLSSSKQAAAAANARYRDDAPPDDAEPDIDVSFVVSGAAADEKVTEAVDDDDESFLDAVIGPAISSIASGSSGRLARALDDLRAAFDELEDAKPGACKEFLDRAARLTMTTTRTTTSQKASQQHLPPPSKSLPRGGTSPPSASATLSPQKASPAPAVARLAHAISDGGQGSAQQADVDEHTTTQSVRSPEPGMFNALLNRYGPSGGAAVVMPVPPTADTALLLDGRT